MNKSKNTHDTFFSIPYSSSSSYTPSTSSNSYTPSTPYRSYNSYNFPSVEISYNPSCSSSSRRNKHYNGKDICKKKDICPGSKSYNYYDANYNKDIGCGYGRSYNYYDYDRDDTYTHHKHHGHHKHYGHHKHHIF